ncbi:fork head domain-containing protein [Mycena vitilis]|nr:fork head domain-containing protein [Mycena vitilis]
MDRETDPNYPHCYPSSAPHNFYPPSSSHSPHPPDPPHMGASPRRRLTGPYYLQNILNSDSEPEVEPSSSRSTAQPEQDADTRSELGQPLAIDAAAYLRRQLCLPPDIPVDLWAIADPPDGQKPFASLPTLIKLAIHGSTRRKLTLKGICDALITRFSWFRTNSTDNAWKNSVRHNLSLNRVFRKIPRDVTQMGKGCYWELDLSRGEGHKRPRKRRKFQKPVESDHDELESVESADPVPQVGAVAVKVEG